MACKYPNCPTPHLAARHTNPCHDSTGRPLPQLPDPSRGDDRWVVVNDWCLAAPGRTCLCDKCTAPKTSIWQRIRAYLQRPAAPRRVTELYRGQDILDPTPVSPEPPGRTGPVVLEDVPD